MIGLNIHVVPVGTVIKNAAGDCLTVTETNAVRSGKRLYVTAANNQKIIDGIANQPFPALKGQQHDN